MHEDPRRRSTTSMIQQVPCFRWFWTHCRVERLSFNSQSVAQHAIE